VNIAGKGLSTCYSTAIAQQHFTIMEVAADRHELVVLRRIMHYAVIHCLLLQTIGPAVRHLIWSLKLTLIGNQCQTVHC